MSSLSSPTLMVVGRNGSPPLLLGSEEGPCGKIVRRGSAERVRRALPFNDHFFTVAVGSLGSQISLCWVADDFLSKLETPGHALAGIHSRPLFR